MCLLLIAVDAVRDRPLLLLGNRDEFHGRASAAAAIWPEDARVVGGRDLVAGGSWLAIRSDGRFAAVTNVRSGLPATAPRSRGALVRDFVLGDEAPDRFLARVEADIDEYGPFNLVLGDANTAWLLDGTRAKAGDLARGVHVISNGPTDVHWPKTERLLRRFEETIARTPDPDDAVLLDLLTDPWQPDDASLPDTGIGLDRERFLAPVFVRAGEHYGTRAGTLAYRRVEGDVALRERGFGAGGVPLGAVSFRYSPRMSRWETRD